MTKIKINSKSALFEKVFLFSLTKSAIQSTEREIEIKAPWGKIAALSWGDPSNPPIFLCHGRLDVCTSFRPLISHLPENYFYVSVDLPGNGRSDHPPRAARLLPTDYMPTLDRVVKHFNWEKFAFIGHSVGTVLGKYYNIVYPGQMTKIVELDPEPAYLQRTPDFRSWYLMYYDEYYSDENYKKYLSAPENAPKITYEEAQSKLMIARGIDEKAADHILERCLAPTEDGKYRITFDQRLKVTALLPFTPTQLKELYTSYSTPTLAILATETIDRGVYEPCPFSTDESAWPHGNYKLEILDSKHDVHLLEEEKVAQHITKFLNSNR